ncbi:MAG: acetylxylan esterase, partial [Opitutaceae bacterium]
MNSIPRRITLLSAAFLSATALCQITDSEPGAVANIPVNYTEAKTGTYTLPDPLKFADGSPVADAKAWREKRRPEIFKLIEENQFGRVPPKPDALLAHDFFDKGTPAFDGKALRKQVTLFFPSSRINHTVDVLLYLPANATGPLPVLLNFGWTANNLAVPDDPGVKVGRVWSPTPGPLPLGNRTAARPMPGPARGPGRNVNVMQVIERGYGFA